MNKFISSGTKVYGTTMGYNRFQYPTDSSILLAEATKVDQLPWQNQQGLQPLLIKNRSALPDNYDSTVVWVTPQDVKTF